MSEDKTKPEFYIDEFNTESDFEGWTLARFKAFEATVQHQLNGSIALINSVATDTEMYKAARVNDYMDVYDGYMKVGPRFISHNYLLSNMLLCRVSTSSSC